MSGASECAEETDFGGKRCVDPRRSLLHGADHAVSHHGQVIDGVVITCIDITAAKKVEHELLDKIAKLEAQIAD
jgi:hypothetical protein